MPDGRSAEEFYSQCLANARTLDQAARRLASAMDAPGAVATAWGSDVFAVQAVLWERILVASPVPQRQFFRVADALFDGLRGAGQGVGDQETCRTVVRAAREALLAACDPDLRGEIQASWPDLAYMGILPAPSQEDLEAAVVQRTGGVPAADFVDQRRREAFDAMAQAQASRVRGDTVGAIQLAYDSDFLALEAYLVESALAAGDDLLLSVTVRWELATASVGQLAGLPDGFVAAVHRVRDVLGAPLSEADADRLRASMAPV
jgi:hypothetical protein